MGRKKKGPPGPLHLQDDSEHIREVIAWALKEGLPIRRPGPHHLKIGPFNYYPTKRRFNSDMAVSVKIHGFEQFQTAVSKWRDHVIRRIESLWE